MCHGYTIWKRGIGSHFLEINSTERCYYRARTIITHDWKRNDQRDDKCYYSDPSMST